MTGLRLALLGPPQIELDGVPVEIKRRKATALLVYLAVTDQEHSRAHLATLFWPEYDEGRAFAYLRQAIWSLRKALDPDRLEIDGDRIALRQTSDIWMDVDHFRRLLAETRTHSHQGIDVCSQCLTPLIEAATLYRDDFMAGFSLRDAPEFDRWQSYQFEKLRRDLANTLERLVFYLTATDNLDAAQIYAQRWLGLDPLDEFAHRSMMYVLARSGQRAAALRQYQEYVNILAVELGVNPLEETRNLAEAIRENTPIPALFGTHPFQTASLDSEVVTRPLGDAGLVEEAVQEASASLTSMEMLFQSSPFFGREQELAQITTHMTDPNCRILTLSGPGGVGKTRLAYQATLDLVPQFPDGVHFVPLAALTSAEFLIFTIASALKIPYYDQEEPGNLLINYLRPKTALLVLDNFEHLVSGASLLAQIVTECPGVKIIVTSRERLNLRAEMSFPVEGLPYPVDGEADPGTSYAALELFIERAQRERLDYTIPAEQTRDVVRICQVLEGLPLAIELAAAWMDTLSPAEILHEISRNLDFLRVEFQDMPSRHQSLRAAFDHSWDLLLEADQPVFMQLAIFQGGFRRSAAEYVAGASLEEIKRFLNSSLLRRVGEGRFEIHELLRQYAVEKLARDPELAGLARDRHCKYFARFTAERIEQLKGGRQTRAIQEIGEDLENVRLGWQWAIDHWFLPEIEQYLDGLSIFFELQGWFQEGDRTFNLLVEKLKSRPKVPPTTRELEALILAKQSAHLGGLSISLGKYEQAGELLETSLETFRHLATDAEITACLYRLGDLARRRGDRETAIRLLEESISVSHGAEDRRNNARALNMLGIVTAEVGEYAKASQLFQASIARLNEIDDRWGVAKALNNLGIVTYYYQQYPEADRLYQESLNINREIGDRHGIAISLNNLGLIAYQMGQYERAMEMHQESLAIFQEIGYALGAGICLKDLGQTSLAMNQPSEAARYFREALEITEKIQALPQILSVLSGIAILRMQEGVLAGAMELLIWVLGHPACDQETKDFCERNISELEYQLSTKEIRSAWERGQFLDYKTIKEELMVVQTPADH